jgi:hypothetical protein
MGVKWIRKKLWLRIGCAVHARAEDVLFMVVVGAYLDELVGTRC